MRRAATIAALFTLALLSGCRYEKVIYSKPMLAGLPGAEYGGEVVPGTRGKSMDPTAAPPGGIRQVTETGEIVLYARNGRHLMVHIYNTLEDDEGDLFVEQVLSERTKQEFIERGYDPKVAFDELQRRKQDILKLFNAMPMGEYTPGLYLKKLNRDEYRVEVTGLGAKGLKWTKMDMVLERGNFKLRWFG